MRETVNASVTNFCSTLWPVSKAWDPDAMDLGRVWLFFTIIFRFVNRVCDHTQFFDPGTFYL